MTEYIGDADATSRALGGGGLRTGDLGRLADGTGGQWLTLLGRGKNVAKCGGISVSLEEVDRLVGSLHGVRETCSVRRADARRGDAITVFYAASPGAVVPTSQVSAHVRRRFDASRIGLRVVETERIPRLRSGKVDRRSLEDRSQEQA
jgi:acyl-CoA synthetase (AMP-forming)/AMP-acid ligase II